MNTELSAVEELALSIATCKEIKAACNDKSHPCNLVVMDQDYRVNSVRQSPEPWAGSLQNAPLLFVSSNPSISAGTNEAENFPTVESHSGLPIYSEWSVADLVDFHTNRFDQSRNKPFVKSNSHYLCKDGEYRGPVKYWREVFKLAKFISGKEIDISNDICLTEVVHCKSKREKGVEKSMKKCAGNYMARILQLSNAKLVISYGAKARDYFTTEVGKSLRTEVSKNFGRFSLKPVSGSHHLGILEIGGKKTLLCALKHNSGYGDEGKTFESALGEELANSFATMYQAIVKGAETVPETREALLARLLD